MSVLRSLIKYPNRVKDMQALFNKNPHLVGAENPTFLKGQNDQAVFFASIALASFGGLQVLRGFWNMSWGVGKKE
ncbi:unnamed protein product [Aphanomyces euteiches]|uniref:Uncharacterized protein n=1 Tax=Aphanomyces euteiches TaxID=100861 RepID=A0A6G0XWY2_9STRA|nr:hypothetical protein Ae201684_000579 [Aphanomyces euteiches]KAH9092067.1 hypothetical protein Ae201684P_011604 [Aphanomyces euteiches]KAH9155816.1 hypothetical protein AeRB84_002239 [Aphanomyces euteiches]